MDRKQTNWEAHIRRAKYPDTTPRAAGEKEVLRAQLENDVTRFLGSGGAVKKLDHTSNRAFQNKETQNRYQNQKSRNKAEWALAREAEIRKRNET